MPLPFSSTSAMLITNSLPYFYNYANATIRSCCNLGSKGKAGGVSPHALHCDSGANDARAPINTIAPNVQHAAEK